MSLGGHHSSVEDKYLESVHDSNNRGMKRVFDNHNNNRDEDIYGPREISNWADVEEYGSRRNVGCYREEEVLTKRSKKQDSGLDESRNAQCKNFRDKGGEEPTDNSKNRKVPEKGRESELRKHGRRGQQNKYDQSDNRHPKNNRSVDRSSNIKVHGGRRNDPRQHGRKYVESENCKPYSSASSGEVLNGTFSKTDYAHEESYEIANYGSYRTHGNPYGRTRGSDRRTSNDSYGKALRTLENLYKTHDKLYGKICDALYRRNNNEKTCNDPYRRTHGDQCRTNEDPSRRTLDPYKRTHDQHRRIYVKAHRGAHDNLHRKTQDKSRGGTFNDAYGKTRDCYTQDDPYRRVEKHNPMRSNLHTSSDRKEYPYSKDRRVDLYEHGRGTKYSDQ